MMQFFPRGQCPFSHMAYHTCNEVKQMTIHKLKEKPRLSAFSYIFSSNADTNAQKIESSRRWTQNNHLFLFAVFGVFLFIKTGYLSFQYFPIMDDYIQYGVYPLFDHPFQEAYLRIGLFATRPLAGLLDIYFWGQLWEHISAAYFLMTCLHFASGLLFYGGLRRCNFTVGPLFLAVYLFFPLGLEATYWLSASTRLVVPMLFCALSLWALSSPRKGHVIAAWALNLISYLFYEQVLITSFLLFWAVCFKNRWKHWPLAVMNVVIVGCWYILFSKMGVNAGRSQISLFSLEQIVYLLRYIYNTFIKLAPALLSSVFWKGLICAPLLLTAVAILLAGTLLYFLAKRPTESSRHLLLGIALFFCPLLLPLVIQDAWFGLRNSFCSLIGLGLILEWAFSRWKPVACAITTLTVFIGTFAGIQILCDYQLVYNQDQTALHAYIETGTIPASTLEPPLPDAYSHHISGITSSDWSFTGAVRAALKDPSYPMIEREKVIT